MANELGLDQQFTILSLQLNAHVVAYSELVVYVALFLDGRITREHLGTLHKDVQNELVAKKFDIERRASLAADEFRARQGGSADAE